MPKIIIVYIKKYGEVKTALCVGCDDRCLIKIDPKGELPEGECIKEVNRERETCTS